MADSGLARWLYAVWYGDGRFGWLLAPLEWLFRALSGARRLGYRLGLLRRRQISVPVVVVGNLAAGGAGKSPLVAWLAAHLQAAGWCVGIVARGYGGLEPDAPLRVARDSDPRVVGDEALMLARETDAIVFVCSRRALAAQAAADAGATVVVADDGLQHYALARDVEIVVIDGERGHGNGHCLPRGPLREPPGRLDEADLVVVAGAAPVGAAAANATPADATPADVVHYTLQLDDARNAATGAQRSLGDFRGTAVHAVAGIAHPARFFAALRDAGLDVLEHPLGDHQRAPDAVLDPDDALPVLMTAKDAVKYAGLTARHWVVPARVSMDDRSVARLQQVLPEPPDGR